MRPKYERTDDDMTFPEDAVIVGIGWEPGLVPLYPPGANVSWGDAIINGDRVCGASEGPYTVEAAFFRAHEIAELYGFSRVMVSIYSRDYWHEEWGELLEGPDLDVSP